MPGFGPVLVGGARPQVDDGFAADLDAQRGATFLRIVEQRRERFAHCLELKLVMTLNLHPRLPEERSVKWPALFQPLRVLGTGAGWAVNHW